MFNLGNAEKNFLVSKNENNKYYDESIKIDINDTNNTHAIIAKYVKDKTVCLDVGCGAGYTGLLLKNDKKCSVYGIDIDKEALKIAKKKKVYEDVYNFSVTDYKSNKYLEFFQNTLKFDYIIFADVLEHVVDPGELIYRFSKKLNAGGKILISIPNVAHMDICTNIINRTFNYNKIGILDNTHLRFFTKSSFLEMIDGINSVYNSNFAVRIIGKTIVNPPRIDLYPNLYKILNQDEEFCVLQYVYEIYEDTSKNKSIIKEEKKMDYCSLLENKLQVCLEQEEIINNQNCQMIELNNVIDGLNQQIKLLNDEKNIIEKERNTIFKNLEKEIQKNNDFLKSNSWKITKPFRDLASLFRFIKSKLKSR